MPGMVMFTFNSSTEEAESGRSPWLQIYFGIQSKFQDNTALLQRENLPQIPPGLYKIKKNLTVSINKQVYDKIILPIKIV